MVRISVIVTTYNRKVFLRECINSILNQTFVDFEIIVVDNFSNYDFHDFIRSFNSSKIQAFQNENNGIIAINRNYGISKSIGEFIAFCDDDDIWFPTKLEIQYNRLQISNSDFISSNFTLFKGEVTNIIEKTNYSAVKNLNHFINKNPVCTSSVLLRNKGNITFPENKILVAIEDYALWLDLFSAGYKFEFINESLLYFRISNANLSLQNWDKMHIQKIHLHTRLLLMKPNFGIKFAIVKSILVNLIKYVLKNSVFVKWFNGNAKLKK